MVDQNLLTAFIALTTLAVLIQTGIVAGLLIASLKMSRQADRAVIETRRLLQPVHQLVEALEATSVHLSQFSATSQGTLREVESRWEKMLQQFRRKVA